MRRTLPIATAVLAAAALAVAIVGFLDESSRPRSSRKEWPFPAAVQGRLTTVLFHSAGLEGGREYSFAPYVNIGFQRTGNAHQRPRSHGGGRYPLDLIGGAPSRKQLNAARSANTLGP